MRSVLFIAVILCVTFLDGKQFRCDYDYYLENQGRFKLHRIPDTWENARLKCYLEGATLVTPIPEHKAKIKYIMDNNNISESGVHTGIHATYSKGNFFSLEGVPLLDIPHVWQSGEPDNYNGNEDCIALRLDGTLADVDCQDTYLPYMCFKEDKDIAVTECGTTDVEYTLDARTGSCYKFHSIPRNWTQAHAACAAEGGYLAIVNSEKEAEVISNVYAKFPEKSIRGTLFNNLAFLGFHYWNLTGEFITIHGKTLKQAGYDKFAPGQPDNAYPGEYCGAVFRDGGLDDAWCDFRLPYICEKDPKRLRCPED